MPLVPSSLPDALLYRRPLVLDGAMGTMLQSYGLTEQDFRGRYDLPGQQTGNNDLLCLTRPDIVHDVHRRYLAAGADIIETNSFNAQRISLADYACQHLVRDINLAAARLARQAAAEAPAPVRFVVGSIGPTNKALSMSPDIADPARRAITFDELADAYTEQMTALIEGGVDALLIETIFDTLNAKAAIYAAQEAMQATQREVPVMLSATLSDNAGRTLSGQTLEAFLVSVAHAHPLSVGLNCSFGAEQMLPHLRNLRARVPYYISAYPNAGLPNQFGLYDETPALMATHVRPFLAEQLVDIIGGCCGTTDEHIRIIADLAHSQLAPSTAAAATSPDAEAPTLSLSGLEPLHLTAEVAFVNVGERCNVAGSRKFLRLIKEHAYDEAIAIARQQVEDGALVLDINMDDGLLDTRSEMQHFLCLLAAEPDVCRVPFMIDSSDWEVIRAALRCIQGKAIVNSISLKEGETVFLQHARELRRLGAAVVVMAFDEEGQATTFERRIAICQRAYQLLTQRADFPSEDIIFDPNVLAIATGMPEHDRYALDFIRATEWIRQNLPGAHISGGVSNLSFSFRGNNYLREAMHAVFLYHARRAGMDMAIMNPATRVTYADIPADQLVIIEDAILARRNDAAERLMKLAVEVSSPATEGGKDATQPKDDNVSAEVPQSGRDDVSQRLIEALRRGTTENLEADLTEALTAYPTPVAIIEGPLMAGMNLVGRLFGEGKMFLPQVVKTARTMKRAVEILQPHLEATQSANLSSAVRRPRALLATVKGDVHDIGKNIVATVMTCNGYDVTDLGVMVPAETIVQQALQMRPDVIGLSGLITPSLAEMVYTVHLLAEAGVDVPIMIGGATTSDLHTALKIAPVYSGPVLHVRDASQNVPLVAPFLDPNQAGTAREALANEQDALRMNAGQADATPPLPLEEARTRKPHFF